MKKPFNIDDDKINTLFNILFNNAQDKSFKTFENKTDNEILSVLQDGNIGFNKDGEKLVFCFNSNGSLKKIDFSGVITEIYNNSHSFYIVFGNGWVIQGGLVNHGSIATMWSKTVTFLKRISLVNPSTQAADMGDDHYGEFGINIGNITNSGFKIYFYTGASNDGVQYIFWKACGWLIN